MHLAARYGRLLLAFARYGLARELTFRANFLVKVFVEVLWLGILIVFYRTVFAKTDLVASWSQDEYLFFVGCYFMLEGFLETFFLDNCNEFAELVRSGNLDFILLKPIDEQFLVSCRSIEWATVPNIFLGIGLMGVSLHRLGWVFDAGQLALFALLFACGLALAYSFLLVLTSMSVWFVRNQSLYEVWWLFTSLMRYPRDIYRGGWAGALGWFFSFIVPVLLVVYVPATTMVRALDPGLAVLTVVATAAMVFLSRRFFRTALGRYRSASS